MRKWFLSIMLVFMALMVFDRAPVIAADSGPDPGIVTIVDSHNMPANAQNTYINVDLPDFNIAYSALEVADFVYSTKSIGGQDHYRVRFLFERTSGWLSTQIRS